MSDRYQLDNPAMLTYFQHVKVGDGCWEWSGIRDSNDYSAWWKEGIRYGAHIAGWVLRHGELPSGTRLHFRHSCTNRWCVNPDHVMPITSAEDMFWFHVQKGDRPDDCWGWTSGFSGSHYPRFSWDGHLIDAHRFSLFLTLGPKFEHSLQVQHLCNNPSCTNPKHLVQGTQADNLRYMRECGRHPTQKTLTGK